MRVLFEAHLKSFAMSLILFISAVSIQFAYPAVRFFLSCCLSSFFLSFITICSQSVGVAFFYVYKSIKCTLNNKFMFYANITARAEI